MESAYLRPTIDSINFSNRSESTQLNKTFTNRILSAVDGLPFNIYNMSYCDFQLTFRMTLLTVASVLDGCLFKSTVESDLILCLQSVLCSLLQVPMNIYMFSYIYICIHICIHIFFLCLYMC
jgi:hypothetical protein